VASRLSDRNIRQYLKDSYIRFINVDSSVLIRKISQQPIEFSNYILTNVQQVVSQSVLIFFTIVAILFYHPLLFLLLFVLLLPPVVLLAWFIRKRLKNIRADNKITSEKTIQHLQETLAGYVESNVFGKDDFFVNRYYSYQNRLNENIATQQTLQGLPSRLIEVFAILGFFILVAINKWSANAPSIDLLNIGVFMAASYKIIPGIVKILNSTGQIKAYEFTLKDLQPSAEITS
jgi:ABC-type multidrug transport system fused ATPase/permease subunit